MFTLNPNLNADEWHSYTRYLALCIYDTHTSPVGFAEFKDTLLNDAEWNPEGVDTYITLGVSTKPQAAVATPSLVVAATGCKTHHAIELQEKGAPRVHPTLAIQNKQVTYNGETKTLAAWSAIVGISVESIVRRYTKSPHDLAYVMRQRYARKV